MERLNVLKDKIFESDNSACFIERERALQDIEKEMYGYSGADRYALIFSKMMSRMSTPVYEYDYFAGRVVEAQPDEGMNAPSTLLAANGHLSPDYSRILRIGLSGIADNMCAKARELGDEESLAFANNANIVISAIRDFALRYADAAREIGATDMAEALSKVPYLPAYDFYSALQSIWLIHMIASCYVGGRDYGFGKFDEYMLPFYEDALKKGKTEDELAKILAGFMVKTNEICGRTTHNHAIKPILSNASKQYINIGGENPNGMSRLVLSAGRLLSTAQPQIIVLLKPEADEKFTDDVFATLSILHDKMSIYNYEPIVGEAIRMGIPEQVARDFTYTACSTFDLHYHTFRREFFIPAPQIFNEVIRNGDYKSIDEITEQFKSSLRPVIQDYIDREERSYSEDMARSVFVLDSILLSDSAKMCRYPCDGRSDYNVLNLFFPGIATIGDSLMVIDKLVFHDKRFTYREFIDIVNQNWVGQEQLRQSIRNMTKFGNDTDADSYTVKMANAYIDVVDSLELKDNFYAAAGFYSLERENSWSDSINATPDGRCDGEPFSENQSPTYGADKSGITALLKSLAKLPLSRTVTGGLNLTFSHAVRSDILKALILSYFKMGGFHVGISMIDREQLCDAMVNPDRHKSLTVRLYGFSEYFISLPDWQQLAVLNRTEYTV